ncbi:MAG: D-amino acid dehydrogenase [Proteobacteria bacterium]|nr:D-amino acid dehydrogenase [Pseudomonadota bacterium]
MKILVLGSGLLGVTVAYELGKRGFDVSVLERNVSSARETSFANGGQLSYSHAEPWANPSVLPKIGKWMFRSDAPLVLRPRADLDMIKWGLKFLRNCTTERAHINCINILRLGLYSREQMQKMVAETGVQFDYGTDGVLHIYSKKEDYDAARAHNDFQAKFGCEQRVLTREQVLALEPTLAHTSRDIVGGIHANIDETGDPFLFCNALAKVAEERYGVKFHYGTTIKEIRSQGNTITGVVTDKGSISADTYIMAMGSYSAVYLKQIGIQVPIYPMKGYSITLKTNEFCPKVSLTDGTHKIVYSRLGDRLRVAGTAEFAGYSQTINEKRVAPIVAAAKVLFPKADWSQEIEKWGCIRPSTPDGPPIMGPSPFKNLFLNSGHGTLGWTQAAGSAVIVADIVEGKKPPILMQGLTLERYA